MAKVTITKTMHVTRVVHKLSISGGDSVESLRRVLEKMPTGAKLTDIEPDDDDQNGMVLWFQEETQEATTSNGDTT